MQVHVVDFSRESRRIAGIFAELLFFANGLIKHYDLHTSIQYPIDIPQTDKETESKLFEKFHIASSISELWLEILNELATPYLPNEGWLETGQISRCTVVRLPLLRLNWYRNDNHFACLLICYTLLCNLYGIKSPDTKAEFANDALVKKAIQSQKQLNKGSDLKGILLKAIRAAPSHIPLHEYENRLNELHGWVERWRSYLQPKYDFLGLQYDDGELTRKSFPGVAVSFKGKEVSKSIFESCFFRKGIAMSNDDLAGEIYPRDDYVGNKLSSRKSKINTSLKDLGVFINETNQILDIEKEKIKKSTDKSTDKSSKNAMKTRK